MRNFVHLLMLVFAMMATAVHNSRGTVNQWAKAKGYKVPHLMEGWNDGLGVWRHLQIPQCGQLQGNYKQQPQTLETTFQRKA